MTHDDIIEWVTNLPGVCAVTASEASGAPEVAWGDTFFFYDPDGDVPANRRLPFATIVTSDYEGFDTASDLFRPGVFRLNIAVGRDTYRELLGHAPSEHAARRADFDYAALDRLLPHPVYAAQGWVSILRPGRVTGAQAQALLVQAHAVATHRHARRRSTSSPS